MLKVTPLGGLGEIGLNMMVLDCEQDLLVIDAGLMFPEEYMPGIDVVIPDFQHLRNQSARIRAVVLTHGHEDHIGADALLSEGIPRSCLWNELHHRAPEGKTQGTPSRQC